MMTEFVSPKSFQGRNLTGTVRLVRDLAADIYANIQQWNNLHIEGLTYLKDITRESHNQNYYENLQTFCDKLENICDNLDGIVRNFDQIKHQLIAISILQKTTDKLFVTWPTIKFGEVAETIYKAYYMEAKSKRKLLENVAHNYTEPWKMLHLAAWVCEPLLTEDLTILLDSLLIETGYR
ncbi:cyclin-dependent kinase 2-interacting protein isoform X2 [Solenopsis invicta]|uniref:cyclin-dependent kinase 2-interacting protein isoform X2 n=1 Tax=Solenopsis invicta TaxID=13686 RepID=UPI000596200F|nr:cyclin-dependent kinase 2-interacting protein isoform X2 [Solenopsis invicta]